MPDKKDYTSKNIKVLEGLEDVRKQFDLVELSDKIKHQGDILTLSRELKIDYNSLKKAIEEGKIAKIFPGINKSKVVPLSRLKTNRDIAKFSKLYNINKMTTRELYGAIKRWNSSLAQDPSLLLNPDEHNLIIGSLLGDASIRKRDRNSCFRVTHSLKQENYIRFKRIILKFFGYSEYIKKKRIIKNREVKMIYLATKTHPTFNYYRNLFYKNNKKAITKKVLDALTPQGLAIWVCDDGSCNNKQGYIVLCTNSFTLEEHKLMKQFFNTRFNLDPTIGFRDKKYYYLRFRQKDSKRLINMIKEFVPESMRYKIGEK